MFRDMILASCKAWYQSDDCKIKELISYIQIQNRMRDAQIEAIQMYLFLKIAGDNKPLSTLFSEGFFNTLDLDDIELRPKTYMFLKENPAAAALFEFSQKYCEDKKLAASLSKTIREDPESIDYEAFFDEEFGGSTYTDYVFSLPMGAGKTYLMAAFIYLDLYFASVDPENPAFAHNFIILAPSGLKSSIMPSLRTIERFDPSWIMDKTAADRIRRMITFDTLDQAASASKSNKAKNPNARKVAMHLADGDATGLVLVTNAEKVILDKYQDATQQLIVDMNIDEEERYANELRAIIGDIPRLSIFIDEVHHAQADTIKLRSVVNRWASRGSVVTVLGFSGTPYLSKKEKVYVSDGITMSNTEIPSVVYYYPLVKGIGNFLKTPTVYCYEDRDNYTEIISDGLRTFLNMHHDSTFSDGTTYKVAIYCTSIEALETVVYPDVRRIVDSFGMNPSETILKYHDGNKEFKPDTDAEMEFRTLDSKTSKIRVILLVQIGKEGWDCRSLDAVILSNVHKSTRNMVLQTCCRCLRQISRNADEKAHIFLSKENQDILSKQLKDEQDMDLTEFQKGVRDQHRIKLYDRSYYVNVPELRLYQFRIKTTIVDDGLDVDANLRSIPIEKLRTDRVIQRRTFDGTLIDRWTEDNEFGRYMVDTATYNGWLDEISKGSFGSINRQNLLEHDGELRPIFDEITFEADGIRYFSSKFDRSEINSRIRRSFVPQRHENVEILPEGDNVSILSIDRFVKEKMVSNPDAYTPSQDAVINCMKADKEGFDGREYMRRRYHYMPYHLDSGFEFKILSLLHKYAQSRDDIEIYYNGDRFLTDFHISCHQRSANRWTSIGRYTPDFLIISRNGDEIGKVLIIETKGALYANDPDFLAKRDYVSNFFVNENNKRFHYEKFRYIYIEDSMDELNIQASIRSAISTFFG